MKRRASTELSRSDCTLSESSGARQGPEIVHFNAGGTRMSTLLQTLRRSSTHFPDSLFAFLFATDAWRDDCDDEAAYFIDRDGETFRHILQVLRCPQMRDEPPPSHIPERAWRYELGHWGLLEPSLSKRKTHETSPSSLAVLGKAVRGRVRSNEACVAETLLRASGYAKRLDLARHSTIYVPVDQCPLPWAQDLGRYLLQESDRLAVIAILQQALTPCHVALGLCKRPDTFRYSFEGIDYQSPAEYTTLELVIELCSDDDDDVV